MFSMKFDARSAEHFFTSSLLFTDETRFGMDGIINIHNQHQWEKENPQSVIHSGYQQQFSINVWAGIVLVIVWQACLYCHISLQATTTEVSSYRICQSYWKMYHRQ
jgi:hypothetical protein